MLKVKVIFQQYKPLKSLISLFVCNSISAGGNTSPIPNANVKYEGQWVPESLRSFQSGPNI